MSNLIINEIFYSIQGESLSAGLPTIFIRLTGCPLRCQYCDTSYAFTEGRKMSFQEIINDIKKYNCKNITVTGGEPLSQKNTKQLINELIDLNYEISIETSNAISIEGLNELVTIILDVKTPDSDESNNNIIANYKFLKKTDQIKFVICSINDYEWSKNYIIQHDLNNICKILMSPSDGQMDIRILAENMLNDNIEARLQTQLHKIIWNNERGR